MTLFMQEPKWRRQGNRRVNTKRLYLAQFTLQRGDFCYIMGIIFFEDWNFYQGVIWLWQKKSERKTTCTYT